MSIRKLTATISGVVAAAIVATVAAMPAAAQGGVELTPWAGIYVPAEPGSPFGARVASASR